MMSIVCLCRLSGKWFWWHLLKCVKSSSIQGWKRFSFPFIGAKALPVAWIAPFHPSGCWWPAGWNTSFRIHDSSGEIEERRRSAFANAVLTYKLFQIIVCIQLLYLLCSHIQSQTSSVECAQPACRPTSCPASKVKAQQILSRTRQINTEFEIKRRLVPTTADGFHGWLPWKRFKAVTCSHTSHEMSGTFLQARNKFECSVQNGQGVWFIANDIRGIMYRVSINLDGSTQKELRCSNTKKRGPTLKPRIQCHRGLFDLIHARYPCRSILGSPAYHSLFPASLCQNHSEQLHLLRWLHWLHWLRSLTFLDSLPDPLLPEFNCRSRGKHGTVLWNCCKNQLPKKIHLITWMMRNLWLTCEEFWPRNWRWRCWRYCSAGVGLAHSPDATPARQWILFGQRKTFDLDPILLWRKMLKPSNCRGPRVGC